MVEQLKDRLYCYNAEVLEVIDGDTAKLRIDFGMRMFMTANCRFYGINTPELHDKDEAIREKALQAKQEVENRLPVGSMVFIESKKLDKYGRPLVKIYYSKNCIDLCEEMLSLGMAIKYLD